MTVDRKKVMDYKGSFDRLGNLPTLSMPNQKTLFLVNYETRYTVTKFIVTPVSGQGKLLR